MELELDGRRCKLMPHVAYVAIKNGLHQDSRVAYFSDGAARFAPECAAHVKSLHTAVMHYLATSLRSSGDDTIDGFPGKMRFVRVH